MFGKSFIFYSYNNNIFANNKNKPYITPHHTPTTTSRVLSECDINTSIYDNDSDMKSVRENFDRQTSQRFEEHNKRMTKNRKKCKEQCDKDIQNIILKDKVHKSLAHKVEKTCLKCGVLGGGVAPVWGLVSGLWYAAWETAATAAAIELATQEGIKAGIQAVIQKIGGSHFSMLSGVKWPNFITESYYSTVDGLIKGVTNAVDSCANAGTTANGIIVEARKLLSSPGKEWFVKTVKAGQDAATDKIATVKAAELGKVEATSTQLYTGIGYSVLAIIIIILIMIIIYLVLRYRRKKKMKKKLQYIKLLEQ
ncbi:hypothetical protein PFFCH_00316 [Plasmodium falciparum FCH/4]|uniref:Surface antigen n=1 Tax=Plasmodium falciparum FCH/4 TaxID=1036724 RepID=A0A024VWK7_PLAFA|nr:hypothetical protein PFFCH_00316 [Plasmodium falciparum FCH/4]